MTKSIKINAENSSAIEAALVDANGKATAHTYTSASEIISLAELADSRLYALIKNKSMMKGAIFYDRSGDGLPNSYNNSRICTNIEIECAKGGDWRLNSVSAIKAYNDCGKSLLKITAQQDAIAISLLRKTYAIKEAATPPAKPEA